MSQTAMPDLLSRGNGDGLCLPDCISEATRMLRIVRLKIYQMIGFGEVELIKVGAQH